MTKSTPYQRIAITHRKNDVRLYLNGNLQFSSADEYRYHEALVYPALGHCKEPRQVLVMGGGDGFAVRELLKDKRVERITLVELDPEMVKIFGHHPRLSQLNGGALRDPRVRVVQADAFCLVRANRREIRSGHHRLPRPRKLFRGQALHLFFSIAFFAVT